MTKSKKAEAGDNNAFDIDANTLFADLAELADTQKSTAEANGKHRNLLKQKLTDRGYHAKALAVIRQFDAMSETQMRDVFRTFIPMFNAGMSGKWGAIIQGDLFDADGYNQSIAAK